MVDMDKIKLWVVTGFVPLVTVALVVLHNEVREQRVFSID